MKRFENLGAKMLTKEQQKKVAGGTGATCLCGNGTIYVCHGDLGNCVKGAIGACGGTGAKCLPAEQ